MNATAEKPDPRRAAYDAWYDEQVRLGLADIEAGNLLSHERFKREMADHLKKLSRKHGRKAA